MKKESSTLLNYVKRMDNTGYKLMSIMVLIGLIGGLFICILTCPSSDIENAENGQNFFHPEEMASEIDRLNNIIIEKDDQIKILNSAIGYLEEGGHVSVNVIECDYEKNIIRVNVKNRLPNQVEVISIGVIGDYVYAEDWYDDYSEDATGLIPASGNLQLIWNNSEAQSLALDENPNSLVMNTSNNTNDENFYQMTFLEDEPYIVRVECSDNTYCYVHIPENSS